MIRDRIAALAPAHDPRLVEAFMRAQYGPALEDLSNTDFGLEVLMAEKDLRIEGEAFAESLAKALGL